jgi:hypothetical protein
MTLTHFRPVKSLYDSLLLAREAQSQTVDDGRMVTDTYHNTDDWGQ